MASTVLWAPMLRHAPFPTILAALALLGAGTGGRVAAAGAPPVTLAAGVTDPALDTDGDGTLDIDDQCPETGAGDLVDEQGCGLSDACPCDGTVDLEPWGSHAAYLGCVKAAGRTMVTEGAHTRKQVRRAIRRAKRSTCGNDNLTRCCVWTTDDLGDPVSRCLQVTVDRCDAYADDPDTDSADDIGPGLCDPTVCETF